VASARARVQRVAALARAQQPSVGRTNDRLTPDCAGAGGIYFFLLPTDMDGLIRFSKAIGATGAETAHADKSRLTPHSEDRDPRRALQA